MRSWIGAVLACVLAVGVAGCTSQAAPEDVASEAKDGVPAEIHTVPRVTDFPPLPASWWQPGLIISDENFFDADSMTAAQIQDFLDEQVPQCATWHPPSGRDHDSGWPYRCMKDQVWEVPFLDEPGDDGRRYCEPIAPRTKATSAEVISIVALACGISPKTLLVTLEKEQGLVTDRWPWQVQYDAATGYACYDSAPCVDAYSGFVGQVFHAARTYQLYVQQPQRFNYRPFVENQILFAPGCEAAPVFIENAATAALYDYTPYQPNADVLAGHLGSSDCEAYGNFNFWRLWFFWFGDPLADDPAEGRVWPQPAR